MMAASSSRDFKRCNLAGRSKTLVFLALTPYAWGQSPVKARRARCFTAFLGFSAIQEFEEIFACKWGSVARAVLKVLLVADHALAACSGTSSAPSCSPAPTPWSLCPGVVHPVARRSGADEVVVR